MIGSAVGANRRRVAASVIAARDQQIADADPAHLAEADFLRGGRHDTVPDLVLELKMAGYLGSRPDVRYIQTPLLAASVSQTGAVPF